MVFAIFLFEHFKPLVLAVLVLKELEPVGCHLNHIVEVALHSLYVGLDARHKFVSLVFVEFQYALHFYLQQSQYILFGHLSHHLRVIGCQSVVDMCAYSIHIGGLFEFLVLVDTFFYEDAFQ